MTADELANEIDNFLKEEEQLPWGTKQVYLDMASTMIRRLVEENDRIIRDLIGASLYEHDYKTLIEKLKPLSDEEIKDIKEHLPPSLSKPELLMLFARLIEERHGIK